jgi:hypothetical protein
MGNKLCAAIEDLVPSRPRNQIKYVSQDLSYPQFDGHFKEGTNNPEHPYDPRSRNGRIFPLSDEAELRCQRVRLGCR